MQPMNQEQREYWLSHFGITPVDLTSAGAEPEGGERWIMMTASQNVDAIAYNSHSRILLVSFRRKEDRPETLPRMYKYYEVDDDLYDDLFSSGSPGATVWERLRRAGVTFSRL